MRYKSLHVWLSLVVVILLLGVGSSWFMFTRLAHERTVSRDDLFNRIQALAVLTRNNTRTGAESQVGAVFREWVSLYPDVTNLRFQAPGGLVLYDYKRDTEALEPYALAIPLEYGIGGQATISVITDVSKWTDARNLQFVQFGVLLALFSTLLVVLTRILLIYRVECNRSAKRSDQLCELNTILRKNEGRLQVYVEQFPDALFVHDLSGRFIDVNRQACISLGYTREELLQMGIADIETDQEIDQIWDALRLLQPAESRLLMGRQRRKDGTLFPVEVRVVRVDRDGQALFIGLARDISLRKKTEKELEMMRYSVDSAGDSIFWISPTGDIRYVNDSACRGRGYAREELLAMKIFDLDPDAKPEAWLLHFERIKTTGSMTFEARHRTKDGRIYPVEVNASHVRIAGKEFNFSTVRDITARKKSEAALRDSEALFRTVLESVALIGLMLDREGRITLCSDHLLSITGWKREEVIGRDWFSTFLPSDQTELIRKDVFIRGIKSGELSRCYENEIVTRAGERRLVSWSNCLMRGESGEIVGLASLGHDITERKQAEQALRASEARYRRVELGTADGLWEWHIPSGKEYCSPRWMEMLGYSADTPPLDFGGFIELVHPEDRAYILASAETSIRDAKPYNVEMRLRRKEGDYLWVLSRAKVDYDEAGKPLSMTGSISDLTATRQLAQQLRQSQKLEAIGTLAGGIAHDFNNILTGIYGFTTLARMSAENNTQTTGYLDEIARAGRRAADLVQRILAFSQTRGGDESMEAVRLDELLAEVVKLLSSATPSTITIISHTASGLPAVRGNSAQLHQILMNLGTNAVQAMGDRSGRLTFNLDTYQVDEHRARSLPGLAAGPCLRLSVSDTGSGMTAAIQERVFEPFFTTKEPGQGTGLGLSVVHGIVQSHRGGISLRSEVDVGTTFEIYLPAINAAPAVRSALPFNMPVGHGECILMVDDEPAVIKTGKLALELLGYTVIIENQPLKALAYFEENPQVFALALLDQTMPDLNGLEFAQRIRAIRPNLPIVIASGHSTSLTPGRLEAAGVRELLSKPYTIAKLAEVVSRNLAPTTIV